jgi:hypothetical protein
VFLERVLLLTVLRVVRAVQLLALEQQTEVVVEAGAAIRQDQQETVVLAWLLLGIQILTLLHLQQLVHQTFQPVVVIVFINSPETVQLLFQDRYGSLRKTRRKQCGT